MRPLEIAEDRDIPVEAVYEALTYCQENWELICEGQDIERGQLEEAGFFDPPSVPDG